MKNFKRVIPVFVAMEEEITPYLPFLKKEKDWYLKNTKKTALYSFGDVLFYIVVTGIGKVNASATTGFVMNSIKNEFDCAPKIAINIGIVGALNQELKANDVVIVKQFCQHDVDVTPLGYKPGQLPGHEVYVAAHEPSLAGLAKKLVTCSSSDAFITNPNILVAADIVDMECAAIAHTLGLFGAKLVSIKIVSDVIGKKGDNAEQYKFNKSDAVRQATRYFRALIEELTGGE